MDDDADDDDGVSEKATTSCHCCYHKTPNSHDTLTNGEGFQTQHSTHQSLLPCMWKSVSYPDTVGQTRTMDDTNIIQTESSTDPHNDGHGDLNGKRRGEDRSDCAKRTPTDLSIYESTISCRLAYAPL